MTNTKKLIEQILTNSTKIKNKQVQDILAVKVLDLIEEPNNFQEIINDAIKIVKKKSKKVSSKLFTLPTSYSGFHIITFFKNIEYCQKILTKNLLDSWHNKNFDFKSNHTNFSSSIVPSKILKKLKDHKFIKLSLEYNKSYRNLDNIANERHNIAHTIKYTPIIPDSKILYEATLEFIEFIIWYEKLIECILKNDKCEKSMEH